MCVGHLQSPLSSETKLILIEYQIFLQSPQMLIQYPFSPPLDMLQTACLSILVLHRK